MKKLTRKILKFCIPFVLLLAFFFAFETSDYFCLRGNPRYSSRAVSATRELFIKHPENIVLGDSRMANMNSEYISEQSGMQWCVMAYGGATLNDTINQFWLAADNTKLKNVVIGVDCYRMNAGNSGSNFETLFLPQAESLWKYLTRYTNWTEAFSAARIDAQNLAAKLFDLPSLSVHVDDPSSLTQADPVFSNETTEGYRRDLFDYSIIIISQTVPYGNPEKYLLKLEEIARYCDENGIALTFVISNCNRVLWDKLIYEYELEPFIAMYKDRLKSIATVYDFEFDGSFARNDDNFLDGLHLTRDNKLWLARIVFGNEDPGLICQKTTKEQYLAAKGE